MVSSTALTTGRFPTFHLGMTAVTAIQMTRANAMLQCLFMKWQVWKYRSASVFWNARLFVVRLSVVNP